MASQYTDPYEEWKAQGRPGGSFQAWQQGQGQPMAAPAATVAPAAAQPWGGGYSSPQDLSSFQNWYNQQQGGNRPEDMDRFLQQATLERWNPYLITEGPNAGKYRSMRGAEGVFDKPQECPPGYGPGGPNETDPCVPYGGGAAATPQAGSPQYQAPAAVTPGMPDLTQIMAGLQPARPVMQQPVSSPQPLQSSLQGLIAPQQAALPGLTGANAARGGSGWSSTSGGLQNMLMPLQKRKVAGSWF